MSVTTAMRGITNWHTLHCDQERCRAAFSVDYHYGGVDELRRIAAADAGWTSRGPRLDAEDFCYQHSVARLLRR